MSNVYENCPVLENEKYMLRLVSPEDATDLQKVYGDKNALPFFNSDNCNGDNFYNPTLEGMSEAIKFWILSYNDKYFVRFTIIDKLTSKAIGTIEMFNRVADDAFNGVGVLRLDVGSEYENQKVLLDILNLIIEPSYELFDCDTIITKAPLYAIERIEALKSYGFEKSEEYLIGHSDNYPYRDYWRVSKKL